MSVSGDIRWTRYRLGYNVRLCRSVSGITQVQLADKAEMDRAFVSNVERGVASASIDTIARLATALNIPVHWLLMVHEPDAILPQKFRRPQEPACLTTPTAEAREAREAIGQTDQDVT